MSDVGEFENEFAAISTMLKAAEKYGLLVEVVWSFGSFMSGDDDVEAAAWAAMSEWDVC